MMPDPSVKCFSRPHPAILNIFLAFNVISYVLLQIISNYINLRIINTAAIVRL